MSRTIFVLSCSATPKAGTSNFIPVTSASASTTKSPRKPRGEWMKKQTMLINEKKLNMMNVDDRKLLEEEMIKFLFEGHDVHIEGYTPPSE